MDMMGQDRHHQNIENPENGIARVRAIIDRDYRLDNSRDGAELLLEGVRVSIYRKDGRYYLGYTNLNTPLFEPSNDADSLMDLYEDLNSDQ